MNRLPCPRTDFASRSSKSRVTELLSEYDARVESKKKASNDETKASKKALGA